MMRAAMAIALGGLVSAAPNGSRRLQSGSCGDLDGNQEVNVSGTKCLRSIPYSLCDRPAPVPAPVPAPAPALNAE